jgi:hypothetical protein
MNFKNLTSIALIVIATTIISIILGFVVLNNNGSSLIAYEIGKSAGKMANPYLFGLSIVFLILILIRVFGKKRRNQLQ